MNEIYHDESLGVHINVVLVRMIMLGYAKVSFTISCDMLKNLQNIIVIKTGEPLPSPTVQDDGCVGDLESS